MMVRREFTGGYYCTTGMRDPGCGIRDAGSGKRDPDDDKGTGKRKKEK